MKILYLPNWKAQQRQLEKPVWVYPVHMAMQATYDRNKGNYVNWVSPWKYEKHDEEHYDEVITEPGRTAFLSLPFPNRVWSNAFDKRYQRYGNYKYHPATHLLSAIGCWYARCGFCIEKGREMVARPVDHVIEEIKDCKRLGFKEIFDDSATMPDKKWLKEFCEKKIAAGLSDIKYGCNMRIDSRADYALMKRAGFRMLLYGIESANQRILDMITKGQKADAIIPTLKEAAKQGLEPHGTFMFGYPGASEAEELETLNLCHYLLRKGILKTAQASVYSPPRTQPNPYSKGHKYTQRIYEAGFTLEFWFNKLRDVRTWEDIKYIGKGIRKAIVHD